MVVTARPGTSPSPVTSILRTCTGGTDLGGSATDSEGHSLGYKTFLNGTLVSNIVIDTTQAATDTIDCVATDTWGIRISQISDGFPHYVHLIGESMFWSMFDDMDDMKKSGPQHFKEGIKGALQRTEAALRAQYDKATQKYRNTEEYEEALWALADSTSDRRQIAEIYDSSYKWIIAKRQGRKLLPRDRLNQRYLSLRKESHGRVVAGYGAGWFAFREAIMRGYVRLRAEDKGVDLGKHHNTAGMK
jgi:hypothetical protein